VAEDKKLLEEIYRRLLASYGRQGWWPVIPDEGGAPRYGEGPKSSRQRLEVMVGALLAQNTSWNGAQLALENLFAAGLLDFEPLRCVPLAELAAVIRASGYYNQKARRIKNLIDFLYRTYGERWERFLAEPQDRMRRMLLELNGIGPETADSIVLYAAGKPSFVIDTYTKRLFYRLGLTPLDIRYEELKARFEEALPPESELYGEYHALVVKHSVTRCKVRKPLCRLCPLEDICRRRGLD